MSKSTAARVSKTSAIKRVHHRVLVALAKGKSLSRAGLMEKVFNGNSVNLKPVLDPLFAGKLIKEVVGKEDGINEVEITDAGRKVAEDGIQDRRLPKPGTVLTRTYKEKTYRVTVLKSGFRMGGEEYSSLSAVAKAIRGSDTEVNGFAFFGLVPKAEKNGKT